MKNLANNQSGGNRLCGQGTRLSFVFILCATAFFAEPATPRSANIYLEHPPHKLADLEMAKLMASRIFSDIGVNLVWVQSQTERSSAYKNTIVIHVSVDTPAELSPRALALAYPYEGTQIRVFYDRVRQMVPPNLVPALLAHVMAHEIAHVLEGTDVHSDSGIMKSRWVARDYAQMSRGNLTFTEFDKSLIYRGLQNRNQELTADSEKR